MRYMVLIFLAISVQAKQLAGELIYQIGDSHQPTGQSHFKLSLHTGAGDIPLIASEQFLFGAPLVEWSNQKVLVTFKNESIRYDQKNPIQSIQLLSNKSITAVTGSQPWVSILCKFNDINAEPKNLSYFQDMYADLPSGLDHYWQEVSYDNINIAGSTAVDWVDLPQPQTHYISEPGSNDDANLNALFDDCTDAADPFVDFASGANGEPFVGINLMFNDVLDCCAWGGARNKSLDGLQKTWRTTWNPPWSYGNIGVIAHEMGHGFGLPHSNNSDQDSSPYDNPWDVMSSATAYGVNDQIYGWMGKHIGMEFKHNLGWVEDMDGFEAQPDSDDQFLLVFSNQQLPPIGHKFIRIPLIDGTSYMIESRQQSGSYESNLAGTAVIIHHVDYNRSQPPWIVDSDIPVADFSDTEGVMWKTGEIFMDDRDGYQLQIISQQPNGFMVRIIGSELDLIFRDSFD